MKSQAEWRQKSLQKNQETGKKSKNKSKYGLKSIMNARPKSQISTYE